MITLPACSGIPLNSSGGMRRIGNHVATAAFIALRVCNESSHKHQPLSDAYVRPVGVMSVGRSKYNTSAEYGNIILQVKANSRPKIFFFSFRIECGRVTTSVIFFLFFCCALNFPSFRQSSK